jgi:hypothetical protein
MIALHAVRPFCPNGTFSPFLFGLVPTLAVHDARLTSQTRTKRVTPQPQDLNPRHTRRATQTDDPRHGVCSIIKHDARPERVARGASSFRRPLKSPGLTVADGDTALATIPKSDWRSA